MDRGIVRGLLAGALLLAATAGFAADPVKDSDAFFAAGKVVHLSIDLSKEALESLRRDPRKYVKATIKEGDKVVYKDVGIHVKGAAGSTRGIDDKPGLTINMDKFDGPSRYFHGMDKWHLANSVQDPSYVSELLVGELYRAAGVPASRVAHAVVTINGRPRGFYYIKEGYDKPFRKRHFKESNGDFFDGGFLRDIDQPLQLLSGEKGRTNFKPLLAAAAEPKLEERFKKLEKLLDIEVFISYLCLQVITWDWDGYPMNRNNYRVYYEPKRDKFHFVPSGMDQVFGDLQGTILPDFQGLVARALMQTPEGRARYLKRMKEIMAKVYSVKALTKRLDELEKRLKPELTKADAGAGRDYAGQVQRLRDGVKARAESVEAQLKSTKK